MRTLTELSTSSNPPSASTHDTTTLGRVSLFADLSAAYRCTRYGLGTCYMRMSKIRMAEFHFRKAVEINPKNAVLLGCLGMVRATSA